MSSCRRFYAMVVLVLALATVALSGCIKIEIVDRDAAAPAPTADAEEQEVQDHDLAVLAVDFDPPLEYEEIMERKKRGEGITLLVAVENTGANTEQNVTVDVELYKDQEKEAILGKTGVIETIAPGEIKIFHFKDTDIPFSYEYRLDVRVVPVLGESLLLNNQKSYDLLITQP